MISTIAYITFLFVSFLVGLIFWTYIRKEDNIVFWRFWRWKTFDDDEKNHIFFLKSWVTFICDNCHDICTVHGIGYIYKHPENRDLSNELPQNSIWCKSCVEIPL